MLNYHYTGALALLALKRFSAAATYLELVVAAPASMHPAGLQLEALKKLTLVHLILYGSVRHFHRPARPIPALTCPAQVKPLPKYTHPNLLRYLKNTPYARFAKAYMGPTGALREFVDKEAQVFGGVRRHASRSRRACL